MSTSAFFSDSLSVIQRSVEFKGSTEYSRDISEHYEVDRCADFINENAFTKVALQFPDDLLHVSASLVALLQSKTSALVFILGDTSYGSCCVDEVAAQHAGADAIIHYGPACLSPTKRFPVLYVFGCGQINIEKCCQSFRSLLPDKTKHVLVLCDVMYAHAMDEVQTRIQEDYENAVFSSIEPTQVESSEPSSQTGSSVEGLKCECSSGTCCGKPQINQQSDPSPISNRTVQKSEHGEEGESLVARTGEDKKEGGVVKENHAERYFGRKFTLKHGTCIEDYSVFYIGAESRTLTNFMMVFNKCTFYSFDPISAVGRQETLNVSRALMRRYHLIEKAKDANVVGILAGTLGVRNYLEIIQHLKRLLKHAGKKSYMFVVGKLNVAKLANFMEVDVYVLVACPENSLIDSKEFYRPVVTPFEMEIACNEAREWTGEYITDFQRLLPGCSAHVEIPAESSSSERTDVSLITGNLRSLGMKKEGGEEPDDSTVGQMGAVIAKEQTLTVSNIHKNASEFLAGRSWQGLERKLGETPVTKAAEGRKGIAAGYTHEQS